MVTLSLLGKQTPPVAVSKGHTGLRIAEPIESKATETETMPCLSILGNNRGGTLSLNNGNGSKAEVEEKKDEADEETTEETDDGMISTR